jgi:hypothetical protein
MFAPLLQVTTALGADTINATAETVASPTIRDNFLSSVSILGKGMLGIFVFMTMFYLLIYGLERVFKTKPEK